MLGPVLVLFPLTVMDRAIHLDDELMGRAVEVEDEGTDGVLGAEA